MTSRLRIAVLICAVAGSLSPMGLALASTAQDAQPSAAAPASGAPQRPGTDAASGYVIGPGDSLEINVWKEPTISGTLPVRPDGMISLSLVHDVQAAGLTPLQLGAAIAGRLKQFITDPLVTVTVLGVNSRKIYLLGEVVKPGELPLLPGMTPLQAIASSGGLSPYANSRHIYILRSVAGKPQRIAFDYKKAIKDGNLQGVTLVSGDTIVVP